MLQDMQYSWKNIRSNHNGLLSLIHRAKAFYKQNDILYELYANEKDALEHSC